MMKIAVLAATLFATAATFSVSAKEQSDGAMSAEVRQEFARYVQINSAAWPLAQANVELCGSAVGPAMGYFTGGSLENRPLVLGVGEGSPAQLGGLQDFDELVSINGTKLKTRKLEQVLPRYNEVLEEEAEVGISMEVKYLRNGVEGVATVTPVEACNFTVIYVPKPIPSTTQGTNVVLGSAIDLYADNPEQIRAYLSRSLARIVLDHQGANLRGGRGFNLLNSAAGFLTGHQLPVTGNALARFRNAENQDLAQDYLSVFLLARTGDDVSGIADFWSGVFSQMTGNKLVGRALGQSQGSPERLVKLAEARDEVLALQQAGKPLVPAAEEDAG